jgi:hypothetical protein
MVWCFPVFLGAMRLKPFGFGFSLAAMKKGNRRQD